MFKNRPERGDFLVIRETSIFATLKYKQNLVVVKLSN